MQSPFEAEYILLDRIGGGCFGTVHRATERATARLVAVKILPIGCVDDGLPRNVAREVLTHSCLGRHPNVVGAHKVFAYRSAIALVMDLCDGDLASLLRTAFSATRRMPFATAMRFCRDLLCALDHCHARGILHRDVKTANVLVHATDGAAHSGRLADFGLSCPSQREGPMTHEVATRWYRAPELLLGARRYTAAVDLWSAGCVLAELLAGTAPSTLFPGAGDIDQLGRIFGLLGVPSPATHPELTSTPDWGKITFQCGSGKGADPHGGLARLYPTVPPAAVALLEGLLRLEPSQRLTAAEALQHPALAALL